MPDFDWIYFAAAFGGGILGAAIGALPSFLLCGAALVFGSVCSIVTGGDTSFNDVVTWGPVLGPHVAFAGGVAAAAFAARKGELSCGRDILSPLIRLRSPIVLLVGGAFGLIGLFLAWGFSRVPLEAAVPWTNVIALSIAVNTLAVRGIFGRTPIFGSLGDLTLCIHDK